MKPVLTWHPVRQIYLMSSRTPASMCSQMRIEIMKALSSGGQVSLFLCARTAYSKEMMSRVGET